MADQRKDDEDIIDLTELISKGADADAAPDKNAAPKREEAATGTKLESLNEASASTPDDDIDDLLAQMDAGDKAETKPAKAAQAAPVAPTVPPAPPDDPTDEPTPDASGHLVDPHEKLDMSGMEEVDNLLSSLNIPLKPASAEADEKKDAAPEAAKPAPAAPTPAAKPAPAPAAPAPEKKADAFDLDALLNPSADVNSFLDAVNSKPLEDTLLEHTTPKKPESAPDQPDQGKQAAKPKEVSPELDDILTSAAKPAAAGKPSGLDDDLDGILSSVFETPSPAKPAAPAQNPAPNPAPEAPAGENPQAMHAFMELSARMDATDERLAAMDATARLDALEERLTNVEALPERLDKVETDLAGLAELPARLERTETDLAAVGELSPRLDALEERLTKAEALSERLDALEERLTNVEALPERLDKTEADVAGLTELPARLQDVETRLQAVSDDFEARVEKAAAAAAAKLLREEIARLLTA
ncbi:MAG: hypothetical protein LBR31_07495 [Desulfovibrio sp.]|jgi:tetrahydromethanopterin S-methyltransferase subunit G|nr:hypothetical protein [Desulfovibrio sp.]